MLDTYSIEASALREEDVRKIQRGFASRLCIPTDNKDESAIKHHLWDLTLIYNATGDKQAFFVREADAFEWNCVCMTCARVRELLALSSQPLTHNRIWSPKTTLQPFDESGDRRIFLAYAATNIWEQICTDPEPSKRPKAKELLMQIAPWVELDLITW
jgi:hypothetical protein